MSRSGSTEGLCAVVFYAAVQFAWSTQPGACTPDCAVVSPDVVSDELFKPCGHPQIYQGRDQAGESYNDFHRKLLVIRLFGMGLMRKVEFARSRHVDCLRGANPNLDELVT